MPATFPRLRSDLIISRQESAEGVVFVVKDPVLGRFVRFKEPEFFIVRQFDGLTPIEDIRRAGEQQFDGSLSQSTLEKFAGKLQTLGLLDPGVVHEHSPDQKLKPRRVQGNAFCLRIKLFDPDLFFKWLLPRLSFAFTRTWAWLSIGVILLAVGVTIVSWGEVHRSLPPLYPGENIVLLCGSFVSIVVAYEFPHRLTCKR